MKQPNLEARIKNMIKSDGLKFKDLKRKSQTASAAEEEKL
jgi:hypothetical protein